MILRFVFGLATLAITFMIYFVIVAVDTTTAGTPPADEVDVSAQEWQTTLCTPPDEVLGELLWLDPLDSLLVADLEDEAFSWGLLAPDTSVFVNYVSPSPPSASNSDNLCVGNLFTLGHGYDVQARYDQCPYHDFEWIGQAQ